MVSGQLATAKLVAAVEATMIIAPKQCPITQRRCEVIEYAAIERNDRL